MAGGFIGQALSYGAALIRWRNAGKPVRPPEEQAAILKICISCQFFRHNGAKCELCGCGLKLGGEKLSWATEACPAVPPKWPAGPLESKRQKRRRQRRETVSEERRIAREARAARKKARAERIERRNADRLIMGGIMPAAVPVKPTEDPLVLCDRNCNPIGHALRGMWQDCAAFYVCGGPSLKKLDLSFLKERGIVSMGLNNVAGFAPVKAMTFSDPAQKFHHGIFFDPAILKFVPKPKLTERVRAKLPDGNFQWTAYDVKACPSIFAFERDGLFEPNEFLTREKASWGVSKRHKENAGKETILFSFFLGLRLLHYLGVRRIYLLGVDFTMTPQAQYAFDQSKHDGGCNSNMNSYRVATKMLAQLRPVFKEAGLEVLQTNKESALRVFDYCDLAHAIEDCRGLVPREPFDLKDYYQKPVHGANPDLAKRDDTEDRGE